MDKVRRSLGIRRSGPHFGKVYTATGVRFIRQALLRPMSVLRDPGCPPSEAGRTGQGMGNFLTGSLAGPTVHGRSLFDLIVEVWALTSAILSTPSRAPSFGGRGFLRGPYECMSVIDPISNARQREN